MRVRSLGWEDPLEEGVATHSSILAWRIPWTRGAWRAIVHGVTRVRHDLATKQKNRVEDIQVILLYIQFCVENKKDTS